MSVIYLISFFSFLFCLSVGLFRIMKGPDDVDRVIAFDLILSVILCALLIAAVRFNVTYFFDNIIVLSALGFFGTMALTFYLSKRGNL